MVELCPRKAQKLELKGFQLAAESKRSITGTGKSRPRQSSDVYGLARSNTNTCNTVQVDLPLARASSSSSKQKRQPSDRARDNIIFMCMIYRTDVRILHLNVVTITFNFLMHGQIPRMLAQCNYVPFIFLTTTMDFNFRFPLPLCQIATTMKNLTMPSVAA